MRARSILIFPDFQEDTIQQLRWRYDPLCDKVPPHLTLVFPFESTLSDAELTHHIKEVLEDFSPFSVILKGLSFRKDGYIYLNITSGGEMIRTLHHQLYQGILAPFLHPTLTYVPHLTIGRLGEKEMRAAKAELAQFDRSFTFQVEQIVLEEILADEGSKIISKHTLTAEPKSSKT